MTCRQVSKRYSAETTAYPNDSPSLNDVHRQKQLQSTKTRPNSSWCCATHTSLQKGCKCQVSGQLIVQKMPMAPQLVGSSAASQAGAFPNHQATLYQMVAAPWLAFKDYTQTVPVYHWGFEWWVWYHKLTAYLTAKQPLNIQLRLLRVRIEVHHMASAECSHRQ